jgi:polysaccharide deacetylase family protein (PEP-CTERM system associated)
MVNRHKVCAEFVVFAATDPARPGLPLTETPPETRRTAQPPAAQGARKKAEPTPPGNLLAQAPARTASVLTVDVEDYFHVEAFSDIVDRAAWSSYPSRIEKNTLRMLDLLDEAEAEATFFVLGWVAERFPGLVREIVGRGHELACHSYWHRLISRLSPAEFRDDTLRAKDAIEQAAGQAVAGYRAPSFSITTRTLWALEVLVEAGFGYDSSIFPIHHDTYGIPDGPRRPVRITTPAGPILEFPITTFRCGGRLNLPVGGGGYLRLLPFWYTGVGVERAAADGVPLIVYVHPWEIDPDQPRLPGRLRSRLRHYTNLSRTHARLRRLLALRRFTSFRRSGLSREAPAADLALTGR